MTDGEIREITVEVSVTGTWRETVVAESEEEAEEVVEENLREHLDTNEGEWGDLGWKVVGSND